MEASVKLDQLPHLCLRKIFQFLSLRDLARCRAVNRQLKFYSDEAEVDQLAVSDDKQPCRDRYSGRPCNSWYLNDKPIDFDFSISWKAFRSAKSSTWLKLEQRLKRLHIHLKSVNNLDLKVLSGLQQLVQLELYLPYECTVHNTLTLPNLKALWVEGADSMETPVAFRLQTPKLEILKCRRFEGLRFDFPETIKRLDCEYHRDSQLRKFKSLEVLRLQCIGSHLNSVRLSDWTNLKEMNLDPSMECYDEDLEEEYSTFNSSLARLLGERKRLKRENLKIWLKKVLLLSADQLESYEVMDSPYAFQFKNYRLLRQEAYPEVDELYFDEVMELDLELSSDFFDKFPKIEYLTASGDVDSEAFEWFLRKANQVRCLTLTNTWLGQAFMDSLPNLNSRLTNLKINDRTTTNFNFILRFEHLEVFETGQHFDGALDLAGKAFRQLNELAIVQFRRGSEWVEITRFSPIKNNYSLSFYSNSDSDNKPCRQLFERDNLRWTELIALHDQRKTSAAAAGRRAKIRRSG